MYLVFDIGGTKSRIAISRDCVTFDEPKIFSTPRTFKSFLEILEKLLYKLEANGKTKFSAGGIAGPIDRKKGSLINSPNLKSWIGEPIRESLAQMIGAPVILENDSALVALGEAVEGAGKGYEIVAYIASGTGLGGARIVDSKIDTARVGFEPGHQIIDFNARKTEKCVSCDEMGHLESYVGGASVEKRFGKSPYEIEDKKIWDEIAKYLAYGLNNVSVLWSPDVIILGGSMILGSPGIEIERVEFYLRNIMRIFPPPIIKKAELKDFGGLHGALALLRDSK